MQRYVISPIIGTGAANNRYRASVSDVSGVNSNSLIPVWASGANIGQPKYRFALSAVCAVNWSAVIAVTNSYVFPVYPLDALMSGMDPDARNAMNQDVAAFDMTGQGMHLDTAFYGDGDSFADVVRGIATQIEPAFNLDTFYAAEVAQ